MPPSRITQAFAKAQAQNRTALGIFITGGDPDFATCREILLGLPSHGADFVELGMPFSDPMADGPSIQKSSQRALKSGARLASVLDLAGEFRHHHPQTPLILMGYYNPIYIYGVNRFLHHAKEIGVDGLIIVDLPTEEDNELCLPALKAGLDMIRLITPTTDDDRLPQVLNHAGGFVYFVSITGITGTASASAASIKAATARLKKTTTLPVVVGFGIRTPEQITAIAPHSAGVVVGSAVVETIAHSLDGKNNAGENTVKNTLNLVTQLAKGCYH